MTPFGREMLEAILHWEGGYADDPADPGGATNYGIADAQSAKATLLVGDRIAGGALFIALAFAMWFVANRLLARLARAPELLITFAIGWAALMAALADFVGFGLEMGGLVAGVALSGSSLRETVAGRLASVREFLLLFFFISLGSHLDLGAISETAGKGLILSLFVLVGNPLIVMAIMGAMGYRKRTGFLAGLTVAQISEFSLVLMAMGLSLGHFTPEDVGLVTLVGLVAITASTYMIYYSHQLYARLERYLGPFERINPRREPISGIEQIRESVDALIFGLGRYGSALARNLSARGMTVLGADFDPQIVRRTRSDGVRVVFADVTDPDIANLVPIESARWAVCAVPGPRRGIMIDDPRLVFLQSLRAAGFAGRTVVTATDDVDAAQMRAVGADLVLLPFEDAADEAADLMTGLKSLDTRHERECEPAPTPKEFAP